MPSITFDGQSFMLDGRRIWLVSGSIHYARVAHEQWPERIHAARLAGLNTIEVPVVWSRHEPRAGHFDFKGDNDLRQFVRLVGAAGLYCILRVGPYIDSGYDFGGLPPWLADVKDVKLRTANGPFLEATSRYINAVADQVRDLQVMSTGAGGPIILVKNETNWTCGHDVLAQQYLGELNRYLREAGIEVPVLLGNSLWQSIESVIDGWSGRREMLSALRQLGTVRPDQPKIVVDMSVGESGICGRAHSASESADLVLRRIAEIVAGGGQFNIEPFFAGTHFGFGGGRATDGPSSFPTASARVGTPVREDGSAGELYPLVRRIATFSARFGKVLANLNRQYQPVVIDPSDRHTASTKDTGRVAPVSVVHAQGSQGGVAFVFAPVGEGGGPLHVNLLLPDGSSLPVDLTGSPAVWCLFDVPISGRSSLDYSSLSALASVGKTLVLFGPAGARGVLAINGSPLEVAVPTGKQPLTTELEGTTVVVCNHAQVDMTYVTDDAVYVGAAGMTPDGRPILPVGATHKQVVRIGSDGAVGTAPSSSPKAHEPSASRVSLGAWSWAGISDYADGTSARYAAIAGPAELGALGAHFGYGWYRITPKGGSRKSHVAFPLASDRLHVYQEGKEIGVYGAGPGAGDQLNVLLRKPTEPVVVLVENLGRVTGGAGLHEKKGLHGHVWELLPIKPGRPKIERGDPLDPLAFKSPLWDVRVGDATLPDRVTWNVQHRGKAPIVVQITPSESGAIPARGLIVLNDKPIAFFDRSGPTTLFLEVDQIGRGNVNFQFALLPDTHGADGAIEPVGDPEELAKVLAHCVHFYEAETNLTQKADWAFARWELPAASAYTDKHRHPSGPTWWKSHFKATRSTLPLSIDMTGMTKGQIYLNGKHVCRYFVATAEGKKVGPQTEYLLPGPWLAPSGDNEIVIFDEHGGHPEKCKLRHGDAAAISGAAE